MPDKRPKKEWADPNREGQAKGKEAERFCSKCGNTVKQTRILKSLNLCEYCVNELREKRDGITSCRGCGKIEPLEIKEHNGYCTQCICSACGKPDPQYVRKTGLCFQCAVNLGDFCRSCGKEATAQVHKNKGFCDECVETGRNKTLGRHRRSTGYQGKRVDGRGTRPTSPNVDQRPLVSESPAVKNALVESKRDIPFTQGRKPAFAKPGVQRRTANPKPGFRSASNESRSDMPIPRGKKPLFAKPSDQRPTTFPKPGMKSSTHGSKPDMPGSRWKKPVLSKPKEQREASLPRDQKEFAFQKPGVKSSAHGSKPDMPGSRWKKPFLSKPKEQRETSLPRDQKESVYQKPGVKSASSESRRETDGYQGKKSLFPKTNEPRQPFGKPGLKKSSRVSSKSTKPMGVRSKTEANKSYKKTSSRGKV